MVVCQNCQVNGPNKYKHEILDSLHYSIFFILFYRLVIETRMIELVQAGMQANQFVSAIDCAGNIMNFTENCAGKSFFFLKTQKRLVLKSLGVIRKVRS